MVPFLTFDSMFIVRFLLGFALFCFLATAMLPFISFFSLIIKMIKKQVFYERCAYHLTQLTSFLSTIFGGIFLFVIVIYWKDVQSLSPVFTYVLWLLGIIFLAGVFIELLVFSFWKNLSKDQLLRIVFTSLPGILFSIVVISMVFLCGYTLSGEISSLQNETDITVLIDIFSPSLRNPLWLAVIAIHFVEATAGGSIGLLWLWFRRNKDNFGRDYYTFAVKYCSEWSAYGAWISLINIMILVYYRYSIVVTQWNMMVSIFLMIVLSAVLWTIIATSKTPLRHKVSMVCSILFFVYAIVCLDTFLQ